MISLIYHYKKTGPRAQHNPACAIGVTGKTTACAWLLSEAHDGSSTLLHRADTTVCSMAALSTTKGFIHTPDVLFTCRCLFTVINAC